MPNKAPVQPTQFYVTPVGTPAGVQSFQSFAATLLAPGGTGIGNQVATDNFNRANVDPIVGNWTNENVAASFEIVSNAVTSDQLANDGGAIWNTWASGNDQYSQVEVTVSGTSSQTGPGPCVRHSATASTQTMYRACLTSGGVIDVQKLVAGAFTDLGTRSVSYVAGTKLGIAIQGTSITIWYGGVQQGAAIIDATISTGVPGLSYSSASTSFSLDNWDAGTTPASGTPSAVLTKLPQKFLSATLSWIGSFAKVLNPGGTTFTKAFNAILFGGGSGPGTPVGVPTLIQHVASAMDVYGLNYMKFSLPNPSLPHNCLIMGIQFHSSGSISSIADDKSNSWTAGPTVTNATYSTTLAIYYVMDAVAGTQVIQVNFSGLSTSPVANQQATVSEFCNVALSSAADGNSGSSSSRTSGSITTTASGDLIYQYGAALSTISTTTGGGFNGTSITKGSGFTLLNADLQVGAVAQYQVQSASGAINPAFTTSGTDTWGSLALALKAAAAGTPMPQGVRIIHVQHILLMSHRLQGRDPNIVMQFPSTGNLLVGLWNGGFGPISAVSDSNSNTWSIPAGPQTMGFSGNTGAQVVYAAAATTGTDLASLTVTTPGTPSADSMIVLYDITGVLSSPFDSGNASTGNQTSTGPLTSGTITPATSNGIVFHVNSIDFHTENAMTSPTGGTFDTFVNDLQDDDPGHSGRDVSPLDMDNAYAHYYNPDTSAVTFTFTNSFTSGGTAGVLTWGGATAAFKGAPISFAAIAKNITKPGLAATLSFVAALAKRSTRTLSAALSFVGTIAKRTTHGLTAATLSFVGAIAKRTTRFLTATLSFVGLQSASKSFLKAFSATLSFVGNIATNLIHGGTTFTQSFSATLFQGVGGTPALIHSYSETNADTNADIYSALPAIGQTFTSDGTVLDSSKFFMSKAGTPTGNVYSKLYALTGTPGINAVPTGAALATSDPINIVTTTGVNALYTFTFSGANRYAMSNGTNYAITVEFTGGDALDALEVRYDTSSPTDAGNLVVNTGSSWTPVASGTDATCFYVYGATAGASAALNLRTGKALQATLSFVGNLASAFGHLSLKAFTATLSTAAALSRTTRKNFVAGLFGPWAGSDNFNRADGSLGVGWFPLSAGGLAISSNQVVGTLSGSNVSGNYRIAETYAPDQYSEVIVTATPTNWAAPSVRNSADNLYVGVYFSGSMQIYKRVSGTFTTVGSSFTCGTLPVGTRLRLEIAGGTVAFLQDGVIRNLAYDSAITSGAPGIAISGTDSTDNWVGANQAYDISYLSTDGNGVESWAIVSRRDGNNFHILRILRPTSPTAGIAHRFLYALPVETDGSYIFGDPITELRLLNAHNAYNVTIVSPGFSIDPWYADHATDDQTAYESFLTSELQPWVTSHLATSGSEQHWLLGFSKSGFGGIDLLLKHPDLFTIGAFWDFPALSLVAYNTLTGMSTNYGTDANFQANYRMTDPFLNAHKAPFVSQNRMWINGYALYQTDVDNFDAKLTSLGIAHTYAASVNRGTHSWGSGWLPSALAALNTLSAGVTWSPPATGAASLTRMISKAASATLSFVAALIEVHSQLFFKSFSATLSFLGNLTSATAHFFTKALTATLSFTGTTSKTRVIQRVLSATLAFSGAFSRMIGKAFSATLSFSTASRKFIKKVLRGTLAFAAFFFKGGAVTVIAGWITRAFATINIAGSSAKATKAGSQLTIQKSSVITGSTLSVTRKK